MGLWKRIKKACGLGSEQTSGKLPEVTRPFPMPPVKPIKKKKKKNGNRKLSSEMPKAVKPRIKRKKTSSGTRGLSTGALLAAAHDDLEDIVESVEDSFTPHHISPEPRVVYEDESDRYTGGNSSYSSNDSGYDGGGSDDSGGGSDD